MLLGTKYYWQNKNGIRNEVHFTRKDCSYHSLCFNLFALLSDCDFRALAHSAMG